MRPLRRVGWGGGRSALLKSPGDGGDQPGCGGTRTQICKAGRQTDTCVHTHMPSCPDTRHARPHTHAMLVQYIFVQADTHVCTRERVPASLMH